MRFVGVLSCGPTPREVDRHIKALTSSVAAIEWLDVLEAESGSEPSLDGGVAVASAVAVVGSDGEKVPLAAPLMCVSYSRDRRDQPAEFRLGSRGDVLARY